LTGKSVVGHYEAMYLVMVVGLVVVAPVASVLIELLAPEARAT